jgi:transposase-like protein
MGRDLALERTWRKRMRAQERSGLTIRQFCQQEGLVDHQFSWWRSELKRRAGNSRNKKSPKSASPVRRKKSTKRSTTTAANFLPVHVESSLAPSVEIVLDQPPRIRVTRGFDAALLREVLRTVEQL